ncbi:MAG: hypothetical protein ACM3VZ_02610 [Acidobacteriota bacterium]
MTAPQPRIHLLSGEDLSCIAQQGAPAGILPHLVQLQDNGTLVFTMRGIQFYKYALQQYGIDTPLNAIHQAVDLHRLHKDLAAAAYCRQVAQLDPHLIGRLSASDSHAHDQIMTKVRAALHAIRHAAAGISGTPEAMAGATPA